MAVLEKEALPLDIIQTILLLQPSKSLQRFKAVCKSWNALISDHDFGKRHHLQQSKSAGNYKILTWKGYEEYCMAKFENGNFQVEAIGEKPHQGKSLLCSGDGLALLSTSCSKSYMLWNPCSNQKTKIPCTYRFDVYITNFGICRGPTLDDYKIVAKSSNYYVVYSCKNESWSKKKKFPFKTGVSRKGGVFVDGFAFWAMTESIHNNPRQIFYFDPRDEKFKKLQKPREIEIEDNRDFMLTSLRGCLCLYDNINLENLEQLRLRIWILNNNNLDSDSWSKLMIIDGVVEELPSWKFMNPLFCSEKNELVIRLGCMDAEIGMYNSVEKKYEEFEIPESSIFTLDSITAPCLDTVFFPVNTKSKK